ncbi:MAG TPA: gephyrin-like molybdotransferase Glp [Microbacteriaceae bacterium]|nr:gephyrin-like molybdotransferase Glp [Microbacteriaceae bacterium]
MADIPASVSVREHLERVLTSIEPLLQTDAPLSRARGRVLAEDVRALVAIPSFDNSAMDGYAVHRDDVAEASTLRPVTLRVVADLPAGTAEDPAVGPGEAARIMTGAPLPSDADAVIPVEDTDRGLPEVVVTAPATTSGYVREAGADTRIGEVVLTAGRILDSQDIATAAATGSRTLPVFPAPRVAILSTGSELLTPGEPLTRGQIYDANSYLLEAQVAEAGGVPVRIGAIPDNLDRLGGALDEIVPGVDAIITSGGVSVGAYDVVKALLSGHGNVWFGKVRMQPGGPQGFGHWSDGTPVFTLPGNPVSSFVSFEVYVRPALRKMQGLTPWERPVVRAVAAQDWTGPAGRAQYMPVALVRGEAEEVPLHVRPSARGGSASHLVASLAAAEGIAIVPEAVTLVEAGTNVDVMLVRN